MMLYIVLNQGSNYKNYDFEVIDNDFIFTVPYMLSDDGKRYNAFEIKITVENAIEMNYVQLVTAFSKKIEELKNGYLLG
jgi:hypothetical protein